MLASIILKYKGKKSLSPQLICLQKARSRSAQGSIEWFSLKLEAGSSVDIKNCNRKPRNSQPLFHNVSGTRATLSAESALLPMLTSCWQPSPTLVNTPRLRVTRINPTRIFLIFYIRNPSHKSNSTRNHCKIVSYRSFSTAARHYFRNQFAKPLFFYFFLRHNNSCCFIWSFFP